MTLDEIKTAVESGARVYWASPAYEVIHNTSNGCDQWLIIYCRGTSRESCWGLTHRDGTTMNGTPGQFFIGKS